MADEKLQFLSTEQILGIFAPGKPASIEVLGSVVRQLAQRLDIQERRFVRLAKMTWALEQRVKALSGGGTASSDEASPGSPTGPPPSSTGVQQVVQTVDPNAPPPADSPPPPPPDGDPFGEFASPEALAVAQLPPDQQAAVLEQAMEAHAVAEKQAEVDADVKFVAEAEKLRRRRR